VLLLQRGDVLQIKGGVAGSEERQIRLPSPQSINLLFAPRIGVG
jgi:hypothetical protein